MSKKNHSPGPVPPGNKSQSGPGFTPAEEEPDVDARKSGAGEGFQEQDPQRRLGDFESAGEHSIQQPSRLNDGDTHSK
jgi:hypothetical protein